MNWTEEQREVIETRDKNILVSAAAGSGKTAVLTERILTLVTDKEHPACGCDVYKGGGGRDEGKNIKGIAEKSGRKRK